MSEMLEFSTVCDPDVWVASEASRQRLDPPLHELEDFDGEYYISPSGRINHEIVTRFIFGHLIDDGHAHNDKGFPWPFRKDGRLNPWYIRKADQCERHQSQGTFTVYGEVIDDPSADH